MAQVGIYETYPMQVVPPHTHTTINEGNVLNMGDVINNNLASYFSQHWSYDAFPDAPTIQADHFNAAVLDPKWTAFHPGGALTPSLDKHHLIYSNTGDAADRLRGHFQVCPAGDFSIILNVDTIMLPTADFWLSGLALFEDATANPNTCKVTVFSMQYALMGGWSLNVLRFTDWQTFGSSLGNLVFINGLPHYLRIRRNGISISYDWSWDGIQWFPMYFEAMEWFATAEFGIIQNNSTPGTLGIALFDWFYYQAADVRISPVGTKFK